MCGIAGLWSTHERGDELRTLERMGNALFRRGPDDGGHWWEPKSGLGFAHRRLAIVELSQAGAQPMESASGRLILTFNGETYNHLSIRERLEAEGKGPWWRGGSDTETLLAAIEAWGLEKALEAVEGAFAFGVWDRKSQTLSLARDRFGEKPLYYGKVGESFVFASDLAAVKVHPEFVGQLSDEAVSLYFMYGYVPWPYSIYCGVWKLPPGHFVTLSSPSGRIEPTRYWSMPRLTKDGSRPPGESEAECVEALDAVLTASVSSQLMGDVPVGCFLSGGIDSAVLAALAAKVSPSPLKSFTIGFEERGFDESVDAAKYAKHLRLDHTSLYVDARQVKAMIPALSEAYTEPFSDASQLPTMLVSRLARTAVTVALTGDGGDELFGGYNRYLFADRVLLKLARVPEWLRRLGRTSALPLSVGNLAVVARVINEVLPASLRSSGPSTAMRKVLAVLDCQTNRQVYDRLTTASSSAAISMRQVPSVSRELALDSRAITDAAVEEFQMADLASYLTSDILVKVDRASMFYSLEGRAPFLGRKVAEFAATLPRAMRLRSGRSKWALRQVLYRYVPSVLVDRPKSGFGIPLDAWLRGPLRDWAGDVVAGFDEQGRWGLDGSGVRALWEAHDTGRADHGTHLWSLLCFESWRRAEGGGRA